MRITVLAENTALSPEIGSEHGLSLLIETMGDKILFDMGQTDLFYHNAKKMNVDLSDVSFAVLSHGHYDHGGGLPAFLSVNEKAPVYISSKAFRPFYNGTEKYIGLPRGSEGTDRLRFAEDGMRLSENAALFCAAGREDKVPFLTPSLKVREGDSLVPDDFSHEIYLEIREEGRRFLFSGCSHRGILNVLEWFRPDVFVGGFHLSGLPLDGDLERLGRSLAAFDTDFYTCHCTGREQYGFLKPLVPRLSYLSAGLSVEIQSEYKKAF